MNNHKRETRVIYILTTDPASTNLFRFSLLDSEEDSFYGHGGRLGKRCKYIWAASWQNQHDDMCAHDSTCISLGIFFVWVRMLLKKWKLNCQIWIELNKNSKIKLSKDINVHVFFFVFFFLQHTNQIKYYSWKVSQSSQAVLLCTSA